MLRSLSTFALVSVMCACGDDVAAVPDVELYIDGELAPESPSINFPDAIAGHDQLAAQIELKNLGPGAFNLVGSPAVRIEKDDHLAFTVVQSTPSKTRYEAGESVVLSVIFRPHSAGRSDARVVIALDTSSQPLAVDLVGEGVDEGADTPVLEVTLDGQPLDDGFDFGTTTSDAPKSATLQIKNAGTGSLTLPVDALELEGAGAFSLGNLRDAELAAGETTDVTVTFTPPSCAAYESVLTIHSTTPVASRDGKLRGRGGTNPQAYADVTESYTFGPDGDVALSDAVAGVRRYVVGNLSVGGFRGQVGVFSWDGCALTTPKALTPTTAGLDAQLFGSQVALDDRGQLLLVTARDFTEAWIFELQADNAAKRLAALATFEPSRGHGKGAAFAGDASAAFIGLTLADSGFDSHGAVLAYARPAGGWIDLPEARWKLWPSNPTGVQQLGTWVASSGDGRVVVAGGFQVVTGRSGPEPGAPILYLWEATGDATDPAWGTPPTVAEPDARSETVRLLMPDDTASAHAAMVIARDGATVALPVPRIDGALAIHVWTRPGASWAGELTLTPSATLVVDHGKESRLVLDRDGGTIYVADPRGLGEILRPSGGWDASAGIGRSFTVPLFGKFAISPDNAAIAGVDADGGAWFLFR